MPANGPDSSARRTLSTMRRRRRPATAIIIANTPTTEEKKSAMWFSLIVTLACLVISTPGFALGADQHVLGTVMAIDENHLEIKTPKGQLVDVHVNKKTKYKEAHNPKDATMPEMGDRVIIMATKGEKKNDPPLLATEVHFSAAKDVPPPMHPDPAQ